jgi:hypothetical protein
MAPCNVGGDAVADGEDAVGHRRAKRGQPAAGQVVDRRMRLAEIEALAAHLFVQRGQRPGAVEPFVALSTTMSGWRKAA